MTEGNSTNSQADLIKHFDDQARFTRAVVVVCTAANLGVLLVMMTWIFSYMPTLVSTTLMGNMREIVFEWNAIEATMPKCKTAPAAAPAGK